MEEVTEWRYRRRGTQLSLAEIRDDGPAEPSRYSATTPPPCRPCREPQSALAPSALDIESERSRSGIKTKLGSPVTRRCDRDRGQPGLAHDKPALVDRQNPVLATVPVSRRRVRGARKMPSPWGTEGSNPSPSSGESCTNLR